MNGCLKLFDLNCCFFFAKVKNMTAGPDFCRKALKPEICLIEYGQEFSDDFFLQLHCREKLLACFPVGSVAIPAAHFTPHCSHTGR